MVRKEKNEKRLPKDGRSFYFDVYYNDSFGNRKEKKSKYFKTKKEALEAERDFLNKINTSDFDDKTISFEDVYKEWLKIKEKRLKSTSYYSLEKRCNLYILSYFNKFKLHSIRMNNINDFIDGLKNKNIGMEYVNKIIGHLRELFNYAKDNYNFDYRIANNIIPYKLDVTQKIRESEWNYWTYEEFSSFIENVDNEYYYLIFNFMYYTGMRMGEVIALKWNDIDFKRKEVRINKSFTNKVSGKKWDIIDPKTTNSVRIIDLDDETLKLLKTHYNNEKKIYNFNDDMFVFGNQKHLSPTTLTRWLNKYIELSEVKKITLHGFRHSHVSFLIHLGLDSRDVAERIGDTVQVVEKTYYHMFPNKKKNTVNMLNNFKNKQKNTR